MCIISMSFDIFYLSQSKQSENSAREISIKIIFICFSVKDGAKI